MRLKGKKILPKHGWGLDRMPAGNVLMPYRLLREHIIRYIFASRFVEGKTVLDIACGSGYGGSYLIDKGAKAVIGGDASKEAINEAIKYYKKNDLEFILLDATKMPINDATFEIVVSFETIEHIPEYEKYLSECHRVLCNNGIFICSTPNVITPGSEKSVNPYHVNEFNLNQIEDILHKYFKKIELFGEGVQNEARTSVKQKFANTIKDKFLWVPYIDKINRLITTFIFKEFRLLALDEIDDFDILWDGKSEPFPLSNYYSVPNNIVAIAYK